MDSRGMSDSDFRQALLQHPKVRAEAYRLAAEKLAKSETWVRDRAFIGRLDGKARALVLSGRLPLAHAREISKIADPTVRNQMATEAAAGYKPGYGPIRDYAMSIAELKRLVAKNLFSLAQAPWKLDVPFAKAPACVDCPHNSANNPGLFDGGVMASGSREEAASRHSNPSVKTEPNAGVCTKPDCFREKSATANRSISAAAGKAARQVLAQPKKDREPVTAKSVASIAALYLEPSKVAAIAKEKIAEGGATKKEKSEIRVQRARTPTEDAKDELDQALQVWGRKQLKEIMSKHKGGLWHVGLLLLSEHKIFQDGVDWRNKKETKWNNPGFVRITSLAASGDLEAISELAKGVSSSRVELVLGDELYNNPGFMPVLAKAFGIKDEPPKLEDFLPKPKPEKPAAKSPKLTKVRIRETKCTGKCGRTEAELKKAKVEWATDAKTICDECADGALDGDDE